MAGNPRRRTALSYDEAERRQDRAVQGLRNLALDDLADDIEAMSVSQYAESKGWEIQENPKRRANKMATETKQDIAADREYWRERAEEAEAKLEEIAGIAEAEPEEDEDDNDHDGDD